jgi:hypothetical protein
MPLYPMAGQDITIRIYHCLYPPLSVMKTSDNPLSQMYADKSHEKYAQVMASNRLIKSGGL